MRPHHACLVVLPLFLAACATEQAAAPAPAPQAPAPQASAPNTPSLCEVPAFTGMTQGGADAVMRVVNTSQPCTFRVWFRSTEPRQNFQSLTVQTRPNNGSLRLDNPVIAYTPNTGFTGTDRFVVTSVPSGVVRVNVTVTAP